MKKKSLSVLVTALPKVLVSCRNTICTSGFPEIKKQISGYKFDSIANFSSAQFGMPIEHQQASCDQGWQWFRSLTLTLIILALLPTSVYAHRGAIDEVDTCRFRVGPEVIHFTAYTPTFSGGKGYCQSIPFLGPTNLVFDYEGKKLRAVTVEFEITKEPEGTRVFYQEPKKIKTGTVDGVVDFSQYGKGDYLAHVTIVHEGKKLDTHLPFTVGMEDGSGSGIMKLLFWVIGSFVFIAFLIWLAKRKEG